MASIKKQLYNARSEYNRLLREIQSQGYSIAPDRKIELPKIPKTPTASSVKRIKKMTEQLKKSATKTVLDSKGRPIEHSYGYIKKREGVEKAKRTRASRKETTLTQYIFDEWLKQLDDVFNTLYLRLTDQGKEERKRLVRDAYDLILETIEEMRTNPNADNYARTLQNNPITSFDIYDSTHAQYYINRIRTSVGVNDEIINNLVQSLDEVQNIADSIANYEGSYWYED